MESKEPLSVGRWKKAEIEILNETVETLTRQGLSATGACEVASHKLSRSAHACWAKWKYNNMKAALDSCNSSTKREEGIITSSNVNPTEKFSIPLPDTDKKLKITIEIA